MNKIFLIISREYFTRVKKKSFLITTILVPLVIVAFYAIIIAVSLKGSTDETKLAVIDKAGIFTDSTLAKSKNLIITFVKNETEQDFVGKYKDLGYQAFLYIPEFDVNASQKFTVHSQSSLSLGNTNAIENLINRAIENKRLIAQGIDPAVYKNLKGNSEIQNTIDTKDGSKKGNAGVAYAVSFACGILIYMMMIVYGTQVMSSVKPFQLMLGKIVGIGAVGLTQFAIWIVIMIVLQSAIPFNFPDMMAQISNGAAGNVEANMMTTITQGLSSLPLTKIVLLFLFYFLAGYLTYASLFAAVGSVVSEDQQEAQQLVFPILMPIILGFVIMTNSINDPNSTMAVFGSIFPLTSPIVMMGRITYDIPVWQILLSMTLLIATFLFFTWVTGKIYRTGILMYGKKPSWKEMLKWAFAKG